MLFGLEETRMACIWPMGQQQQQARQQQQWTALLLAGV